MPRLAHSIDQAVLELAILLPHLPQSLPLQVSPPDLCPSVTSVSFPTCHQYGSDAKRKQEGKQWLRRGGRSQSPFWFPGSHQQFKSSLQGEISTLVSWHPLPSAALAIPCSPGSHGRPRGDGCFLYFPREAQREEVNGGGEGRTEGCTDIEGTVAVPLSTNSSFILSHVGC